MNTLRITLLIALTTQYGLGIESASVAQCPDFVDEGSDLVCECLGVSSEVELSWPEYSDTPVLKQKAVSRQQNGTEYTCQVNEKGKISTVKYTLKVAYGPDDGDVRISCPEFFATNGSKRLILQCKFGLTYPRPDITWTAGPCKNGKIKDNCTIKPDPLFNDDQYFECRANSYNLQRFATANCTLHLKYPPEKPPVISGHMDGQIHKPGDKIICTVEGGKPLVDYVIFNCTNPPHPDQPDTNETSSKSSSVVVGDWQKRDFQTVCTCSAVWGPEPGLYHKTKSITFPVQPATRSRPEDKECEKDEFTVCIGFAVTGWIGWIGWIVAAILLIKDYLYPRCWTKTKSEASKQEPRRAATQNIDTQTNTSSSAETGRPKHEPPKDIGTAIYLVPQPDDISPNLQIEAPETTAEGYAIVVDMEDGLEDPDVDDNANEKTPLNGHSHNETEICETTQNAVLSGRGARGEARRYPSPNPDDADSKGLKS